MDSNGVTDLINSDSYSSVGQDREVEYEPMLVFCCLSVVCSDSISFVCVELTGLQGYLWPLCKLSCVLDSICPATRISF